MSRSSVAVFAAILLMAVSSWAQTPQSSPQVFRATPGHNNDVPCDHLPAGAVHSVPPPFNRYMRFRCSEFLGQGLGPVENFHWADPNGHGIGLVASSAAGPAEAGGQRHFPLSWYTQLEPMPLSLADQEALRADFKQVIQPRFLTGTTFLELEAKTSNGEVKRIYLVVPNAKVTRPKWLLGFECNGACFREDHEPLMFIGEPNG